LYPIMKKYKLFDSLKNKIFITFSGFAILIICLISFVFVHINRKAIMTKSIDSIISTSAIIDFCCAERFNSTYRIIDMGDSTIVRNFITSTENNRYRTAYDLIITMRSYRESRIFDKNVKNVYIIGKNGACYNERTGVIDSDTELISSLMDEFFYRSYDNYDVTFGSDFYCFPTDNHNNHNENLFFGSKIVYNTEEYGIIVIEMSPDFVVELLNEISSESGMSYMLINGDKLVSDDLNSKVKWAMKLCIPQINNLNGKGCIRQSIESTEYSVFYNNEPENSQWRLISAIETDKLTDDGGMYSTMIFLSIIGSISVALALYAYFSQHLVKPIEELGNKLDIVADGNWQEHIDVHGNDEVSNLEGRYNSLIDKLSELREKMAQEQENIKHAEIALMQEQINPHFIYNTLELVMWTAAETNDVEVITIIEQLSRYFRIGLSSGAETITVSEELEHVESYLEIQKKRYGKSLNYNIDVDDNIKMFYIPKITLQPIVENAISHGIRNVQGGGTITINGEKSDDDTIIIRVIDDGAGMTEQELKEVRRRSVEHDKSRDGSSHGFGLYNVNNRLKYYCGEEYGITINSEKDKGTEVLIMFKFDNPA